MIPALALGAMPAGARPGEYMAAGPWCFAGREDLFPDWETAYCFAPEPLADAALLPLAAKAAQTLAADMILPISETLCGHAASLPPVYWQTLLAPWLVETARLIVDRALLCQAMRQKWSHMPLRVPLLPPECEFNFDNEHDFSLRGSRGILFNHWLLSRLLEISWPEKWQKITEPARHENTPARIRPDFGEYCRRIVRKIFLLPLFPRLKGMSIIQSLEFSLALAGPRREPDHSLDLRSFRDEKSLAGIPIPPRPEFLFLKALPASLRGLRHPAAIAKAAWPRLRVASVTSYENSAYRQKLAIWRARGNSIAYAQHGCNYGWVKTCCDAEFVEYSQDVFFTWGWKKHGSSKGNFLPMPCPQLAAIDNKWRGAQSSSLIFVGTEMPAFGNRLNSSPTPLRFVEYRQAKSGFLQALPAFLHGAIFYRPYFSLPGCLEDAPWLMARHPWLRLCHGPLLPQILSCRLLVVDHHGTTMLEALAANIPLVMYWNRKNWPLTPECDKLLDMLQDCEIWHPTPQAAARKIAAIWDNPARWWNEAKTVKARRALRREHAFCDPHNLNARWRHVLKSL